MIMKLKEGRVERSRSLGVQRRIVAVAVRRLGKLTWKAEN